MDTGTRNLRARWRRLLTLPLCLIAAPAAAQMPDVDGAVIAEMNEFQAIVYGLLFVIGALLTLIAFLVVSQTRLANKMSEAAHKSAEAQFALIAPLARLDAKVRDDED